MKTTLKLSTIILLLSTISLLSSCQPDNIAAKLPESEFYNLSATALTDGHEISMSQYKGKCVLVVNTASKCGYTPQYAELETLYKKYKDQGLEILGFPCNQFGAQEPGSNEDIYSFCQENYGVTFQMFSKIDVNGENEHPIYTFLKKNKVGDIKWNFTKFLINRDGEVVERFETQIKPSDIADEIELYLK